MGEKKAKQVDYKSLIVEKYMDYVLENGSEPVSVFKFAKALKLDEAEFYTYYTSFEAIKEAIWESVFDQTLLEVKGQEVYATYSSREKLLSFFFTLVEELKKKRSYLLSLYGTKAAVGFPLPDEMKPFKRKFKEFVSNVLSEGKETEEIVNRPYISDKYDEALWLQVLFVFRYWLKDTSPGFEKTDAAIEKSVNLAFDLMGKNAMDSFLDFAKFLHQSR